MKFALIGPAPPFRGGIAQHTAVAYGALAADHDVVLYPFARQYPALLFPGKSQTAPDAGPQLPMREWFDPYRLSSWRRVARSVADQSPDLVLIQWWHPWFAVPTSALLDMLRRRLGGASRLAVWCHNVYPHSPVPLQRLLARSVMRRAGMVLVHAKSEAERVAELAPHVPVHRLHLPCLAPPTGGIAREEARQQLQMDDGRWLLFFGYIRPYKGLDDLLDALPLTRHGPRLVVAGEVYGNRRRIEQRLARLGIADRVRLVDRFVAADEIPALFSAADAVVLPYRRATQSSVLPLAARYQRPVILTEVGGLREAAGDIAVVVPPRSPRALAEAIDDVLDAQPPDARLFEEAEARFAPQSLRHALEAIVSRGTQAGAP